MTQLEAKITAIWQATLSKLLTTEATESTIHNIKIAFIGGLEAGAGASSDEVRNAVAWIESHA